MSTLKVGDRVRETAEIIDMERQVCKMLGVPFDAPEGGRTGTITSIGSGDVLGVTVANDNIVFVEVDPEYAGVDGTREFPYTRDDLELLA